MKTIKTIILSIISLGCFGQINTDKTAIFRIIETYQNDSIVSAKEQFSLFVEQYPESKYKIVAYYHLGEIENKQGNTEQAIKLYKKTISTRVPDSIDMNCRNFSAKKLAKIYIDKNKFNTAIRFLNKAKKRFTYNSFCGNAYASDNIYMADKYSDCYIKLGKNKKAIDVLTPYIFENGLSPNDKLVEKIYSLYLKLYTKDEIKKEYLDAEKTLVILETKYNGIKYFSPMINIFGKKAYVTVLVNIFDRLDESMTDEERRKKTIETIHNSYVFELCTKD